MLNYYAIDNKMLRSVADEERRNTNIPYMDRYN